MGAEHSSSTTTGSWGRTCTWSAAILGVVLIFAPFMFGYQAKLFALWNDIVLGVGIAILSGAVAAAQPNLRGNSAGWALTSLWVSAAGGVWLIFAPFFLNYTDAAAALGTDIVLGIAVALLAGAVAMAKPSLS